MEHASRSRREPCSTCDRETAAGSVLFPARRVLAGDGATEAARYLCASCEKDIHRARKAAHLSDAELRRLIEDGSAAGMTYAGMGSLSGFVG
jgi:hypothetical protein